MISSIKFTTPVLLEWFCSIQLWLVKGWKEARSALLLQIAEWITLLSGNAGKGEKHHQKLEKQKSIYLLFI